MCICKRTRQVVVRGDSYILATLAVDQARTVQRDGPEWIGGAQVVESVAKRECSTYVEVEEREKRMITRERTR